MLQAAWKEFRKSRIHICAKQIKTRNPEKGDKARKKKRLWSNEHSKVIIHVQLQSTAREWGRQQTGHLEDWCAHPSRWWRCPEGNSRRSWKNKGFPRYTQKPDLTGPSNYIEKEKWIKNEYVPGEWTQWLRALAAIVKDQGSIPSAHVAAHNGCSSGPGRLKAFFWPPWSTYILVGQTLIQIK